MTANVGKHRQRAGGDQRATDGQTVEAVREIDRVGGPYQHKDNENDEWQKRDGPQMRIGNQPANHQVRTEALEKRHHQVRGVLSFSLQQDQHHGDDKRNQRLQQ